MVADQAITLKLSAQGFDDVGQKIDQVGGRLDKLTNHLKNMGQSTVSFSAVGAAVTALAASFKQTIDAADNINDLSQKIGISVRDLGTWQLAAEQSGASLETIGRGIKSLAPTIGQFSKQFEQLGIDTKDPSKALIDLADIVASMPDGFEKNALAVKLFGKAGADLIPLLNLGSQGLTEARDKAAKYAEALAALAPQADAFNDALKELELRSKARTMGFLTEQVRGATGLIEFFADATSGVKGFARAMDFLSDMVPKWTGGLYLLVQGLNSVAKAADSDAARKVAALAGFGSDPGKRLSVGKIGGSKGLSADEEEALGERNAKALADRAKVDSLRKLLGLGSAGTKSAVEKDPLAHFMASLREKQALLQAELESDGKLSEAKKTRIELEAKLAEILRNNPKLSRAEADSAIQQLGTTLDLIEAKKKDEQISFAAGERANAAYEAASKSAQAAFDETKAIKDRTAEVGLSADAMLRLKQARIEEEIVALRRLPIMQDEFTAASETGQKIQENIDALEDRKRALASDLDASRAWSTGVNDAINQYIDVATSAANQSRTLFTNAFKSMEDALVQFVKTGKLDFASLADSIISDLIRIQVQENITKPLAGMMKGGGGIDVTGTFLDSLIFGSGGFFANGGIMSPAGALPLNKYAGGGIATSPQLAVFGEGSMNEAFVPLPDGRSIPVQMRGGGGGGVSISMPVSIDARGASADVVPLIQASMQQVLAQMRAEVPNLMRRQQLRSGVTPYRG